MDPDIIRKSLNDYIEKLPALPTSVAKIMEICNDPQSSPADLSKVISLDPVLMGRVMKLINSAYYGLTNEVTSLVRAIIMLGLNTVKNLALSTAVLGTVGMRNTKVLNSEGFWRHSLCTGVTSKLIAQKMGIPSKDLEEFFIAGLLHDIGKIPFNNKYPDEYSRTILSAGEENIILATAEKRDFGCDHSEIGQTIASSWHLSEGLCHVLSHHHEKYEGPYKNLVFSVIAANYFANRMEFGFSGNKSPGEPDKEVFHHLKIQWVDLEKMEPELVEAIDNAKIFLRLAG